MGTSITLTASDGHELAAWRADPPGDAKAAIVVVQEIFGVNSHIRGVADDFAREGYRVIAPALFDRTQRGVEFGYAEADIARGRELRAKVKDADALKDIQVAVDSLRYCGKVGVVGYCWGGTLAWLAACRQDFGAAVSYYGGNVHDTRAAMPRCPTMLHFGDRDGSIPMEHVEAIKAAHPELPIHVYVGAGHGFHCDQRGSFHPESAKLARDRTLKFFARHLLGVTV